MFTTQQIQEIAKKLEAMGLKDSQFPMVDSLNGSETIAIVQNGENKRTTLGDIFRPFQDYIVPPIQTAILDSEKNIIDAVEAAENSINANINNDMQALSSVVGEQAARVITELSESISEIHDIVSQLDLQEVIDNDNNNRDTLRSDIINLNTALKNYILGIQNTLVQELTGIVNSINEYTENCKEETVERIDTFQETLMTNLGTEFSALTNLVNRVQENLQQLVSDTGNQILTSISVSKTEIMNQNTEYYNNTIATVTEYYNNILQRLVTVMDNINSTIESARQSIIERVDSLEQNIGDTLTAIETRLGQSLDQIRSDILKQQDDIRSILSEKLDYTQDWLEQNDVKEVTLQVRCQVEDAVISINNIFTSSAVFIKGALANIRITAPGYHPFTQIVNVFRDTELDIVLDVINDTGYHIVEIRPVPADSIVTMDNEIKSRDVYKTGSLVHIKVEHEHYETWEYDLEVKGDTILSVPLVPMKYTLSVTAVPENSTIVINGQTVNSLTADYGTSYVVEVSHDGYDSKTVDVGVIDKDTQITVNLDIKQITVTIETDPVDTLTTMNGQNVKTLTVDYGTVINWTASLTGYLDQSGSCSAVEDKTIRVVMERKYVIIPEGHTLFTHEGGTNRIAVQSNTEWIFK